MPTETKHYCRRHPDREVEVTDHHAHIQVNGTAVNYKDVLCEECYSELILWMNGDLRENYAFARSIWQRIRDWYLMKNRAKR